MKNENRTKQEFIQELKKLQAELKRKKSEMFSRDQLSTILNESKERYRTIYESSLGIYIHDFQGRFLDMNQAALNIIGYTKEEIPSIRFEMLFDEDQLQNVYQKIKEMTKEGYAGRPIEYKVRKKNGEFVWVEVERFIIYKKRKPYAIQGIVRDISDRKKMVLEKQREHDIMMRIVETSPAAIVMVNQEGKITFANANAEKILGMPSYQISDRMRNDTKWQVADYHGNPFLDEELPFRSVMKTGKPVYDIKHTFRKIDGRIMVLSINATPIFDEIGKVNGMVATIEDVTKRMQAEETLKDSRKRLEMALESGKADSWEMNLVTGDFFYTERWTKMLGYNSHEIETKIDVIMKLIHRDDVLNHYKSLKAYIDGKTPIFETEYRIFKKNGEWIWVFSRGEAVEWDKTGKPVRLLGTAFDITERKEAEDAVKLERDKAQRYLDIAGVIFVALNKKGEVTLINQKGSNVLGYREKEMIGKNWFENYIPKGGRTKVKAVFKQMISGDIEPFGYTENAILNKKGKKRLIAWYNTLLRDESNNIVGTLSSGEDITEREKTEEQIKRSLREKEVLLKEIHHRVKNNLQVIISLLNLQAEKMDDPSSIEAFKEANQRIYSMALVHEQLYRSEDFATIHIKDFIESMVEKLYHNYTIDDRIRLDLKIANVGLGLTTAIPCGLILNELISNAMKHAFPEQRKGVIRITFRLFKNKKCKLVVEDDGIGISRDLDIRKTQSLGMQLVNILSEQIEGKITLDRERGTRFTLVFELKE